MRRIIHLPIIRASVATGIGLALLVFGSTNARSVEYMKICGLNGAGYFYIPQTATCLNAEQIAENQYQIAREFSRAMRGIAMSAAIVTPFLPDRSNYAVSFHWASYQGRDAFGFSGAIRLQGNLSLSIGLALGTDSGSVKIATKQISQTGIYVPVRDWRTTDLLGKVGLNYYW